MNRELTLEIVKEFFKDKPLIERVYLFGSFKRREETENSDLDLLVDMKETINTLGVPLMKFICINYLKIINFIQSYYIRVGLLRASLSLRSHWDVTSPSDP